MAHHLSWFLTFIKTLEIFLVGEIKKLCVQIHLFQRTCVKILYFWWGERCYSEISLIFFKILRKIAKNGRIVFLLYFIEYIYHSISLASIHSSSGSFIASLNCCINLGSLDKSIVAKSPR